MADLAFRTLERLSGLDPESEIDALERAIRAGAGDLGPLALAPARQHPDFGYLLHAWEQTTLDGYVHSAPTSGAHRWASSRFDRGGLTICSVGRMRGLCKRFSSDIDAFLWPARPRIFRAKSCPRCMHLVLAPPHGKGVPCLRQIHVRLAKLRRDLEHAD